MPSPGSARIVVIRMGLGINKRKVQGSRFRVHGSDCTDFNLLLSRRIYLLQLKVRKND